jgi:F0F1-type ATP synthase membrane subunit c/vacuolar-type H+-ATPase subunit K
MLVSSLFFKKTILTNQPVYVLLCHTPLQKFFNTKFLWNYCFQSIKTNLFLFKTFIVLKKSNKKVLTLPKIYFLKKPEIFTANFLKKTRASSLLLTANNSAYLNSIQSFQFFLICMLITTAKLLLISFTMFPIAFAALASGILFAGYNLAVARNPEEKDTLFSNTMM